MPLSVSKGHISVFAECSLLQVEQRSDDLCVSSLKPLEQVCVFLYQELQSWMQRGEM